MICPHLKNNTCIVATKLANHKALTNEATCNVCKKLENPCTLNKVTYGIAIVTLIELEKPVPTVYYEKINIKTKSVISNSGPGTELKKLISWFYSPDKRKCKCNNRIQKMNKWGPDECEKRIETIIRWLKHSARIAKIPFFQPAVLLLVSKAIKNARLQSQQLLE